MRIEEIRQLPIEEVELRLRDALEEYANLRFQHATRQLDNPLRLRMIRKDIARLKTVIREHQLGIRLAPGAQQASEQEKA
ncbi:MAG TPA: 50S ribosomal protein L29 [Bacteroidetes bacterium]|nr:50S ribosomal protein L29 [Calditrichota bacterium]HFE53894.1 50S ribosomal protein L29 [Bacteroidota bacterium]